MASSEESITYTVIGSDFMGKGCSETTKLHHAKRETKCGGAIFAIFHWKKQQDVEQEDWHFT